MLHNRERSDSKPLAYLNIEKSGKKTQKQMMLNDIENQNNLNLERQPEVPSNIIAEKTTVAKSKIITFDMSLLDQ